LSRVEVKDERVDTTGCVGLLYLKIVVFYMLCPMGVLVF
jgi:hypothetical protein